MAVWKAKITVKGSLVAGKIIYMCEVASGFKTSEKDKGWSVHSTECTSKLTHVSRR